MSPEEKLAALLQPAEFRSRPLSSRERRYFGMRLRRNQQRWNSEWQQTAVIMAMIYLGCLAGIWFSEELPWWSAFFLLGLIVFAGTVMVLQEYWLFQIQRREINALLKAGTCDELRVTTEEVWVIENLAYGTWWHLCASKEARVILIDGGQEVFPRFPATDFSLRVYKLANGNTVELRIIPSGERLLPAREFAIDFYYSILDQPCYSFSGTLASFCETLRGTGIDLEETCPANTS